MCFISNFFLFINNFLIDLVNLNLYTVSFFVAGTIFFIICIAYLYLRFQALRDNKIAALSYSVNIGVLGFLKKWSLVFFITSLLISVSIYKVFGDTMTISFILGVLLSYISIVIGLKSAHKGAGRTVLSAKAGISKAFSITFISGIVSGFAFISLSLMGISFLMYYLNNDLDALNGIWGFALGFTFVTLLLRLIGGVYAKSADISSYFLQKLHIKNKKKRSLNLSYIADNIGDNINNIAGLGMDIVDSGVTTIISSIILASIIPIVDISKDIGISVTRSSLIILPIVISTIGLLSSFIGVITQIFFKIKNPVKSLDIINITVSFVFFILSFLLIYFFNYPLRLFIPILCGGLLSFITTKVFEIYTNGSFVRYILKYSFRGASGNIISGLYKAAVLVVVMLSLLIATVYISYSFAGMYGLSLASLGLISNFAFILMVGSSGPICDNAHSISVISGQNSSINKITADLDMIGNTGAVITKTLSISASILTTLALFVVYKQEVDFYYKSQLLMDITNINILMGLLFGVGFVIALVSYIIKSTDNMIDSMLNYYQENQITNKICKSWISKVYFFKRFFMKKVMHIEELNNLCIAKYSFCINEIKYFINYFINKSIKNVILLPLFIICIPILILLTGSELIIGIMFGSFLFGMGLSFLMYNSGALWDNAKKANYIYQIKYRTVEIEKDNILAGDIIGDYFKDVIGPFINVSIKLIFIIALLIVPLTKHSLL